MGLPNIIKKNEQEVAGMLNEYTPLGEGIEYETQNPHKKRMEEMDKKIREPGAMRGVRELEAKSLEHGIWKFDAERRHKDRKNCLEMLKMDLEKQEGGIRVQFLQDFMMFQEARTMKVSDFCSRPKYDKAGKTEEDAVAHKL